MRGIPELEDLLAPAPGRADLEPWGGLSHRRAVAVNHVRTPQGGSGEMSVDSSACLRRLPPLLRSPPSPPS